MSAMTQSRQRGKEKRREATKTPKTDEVVRCEQCNMEMQANPPFASSSWLRIVYEAIKRLHNEANPHRKYFHYKHDICSYIDKNWFSLCPEKKKTTTWNNTVSAVITTHRKLFKSNRKQSGYWTLRSASQALDPEELKEVVKKSPSKKRTHSEMSSPVTPKATKPRGLTEEEVYQLKNSASPSQPRVYYAISLRRKSKPGSDDDLGSPSRRTRSATGGDENEEEEYSMLLEDSLIQIPVPKPWMDRVIKHPLVADTYTIEGPIPIPRWVEVDDDEGFDEDDSIGPSPNKKQKIASPKSDKEKAGSEEEDGDEDISDARFLALHQPYENLEKRLQKYFVNNQNNGTTVNNTNH